MSSPTIEQGRAALRDGDATTAQRAFELALAEVESGEVLEGLAEAPYLEREYAASAAHYERAYAAYRQEGRSMAAGRADRRPGGRPGPRTGAGPRCRSTG